MKSKYVVEAMYAMYCMGPEGKPCSVEEVGRYYRMSRQAVFDIFKARGYKLRSKKKQTGVVIDGRKWTPRKDGYWRATGGDRKQLHIYIWERKHGKMKVGYGIHHKDFNRANNDITNLECLSIAEITRKYGARLNQFTSPRGSRKWKNGRIIPRRVI